MLEALWSQLKLTPTGQNTNNLSIKKDNCSGLKHIKYLQTYELIMVLKSHCQSLCYVPHCITQMLHHQKPTDGVQIRSFQIYSVLHTCRLKTIEIAQFQALHNSNFSKNILCHIWKLQISASILFILFPDSSDVVN